jgi:hypothetical protein
MSTILSNKFQINGVVSTDKTVLQNINALCDAAGCWMTYDIAEARWSVIINQPGDSVASFDDSNIIGGINVSGSGITELYNSGTIEFPHKDLRDQKDYVDLTTPEGDRFVNELDNKLTISTDLLNDPIQASYILRTELKQSRVDKVIQFRTDYSKIGLKAGDLIDITSEMYGYDSKVFRITKLEEEDSEVLAISITAIEYDEAVYDDTNLVREVRVKTTGILPKSANSPVLTSDAVAVTNQNVVGTAESITPALIDAAVLLGSGPLYDFLKASSNLTTAGFKEENPGASIPAFYTNTMFISGSYVLGEFNDYAGSVTPPGGIQGEGFSGDTSASAFVQWTLPDAFDTMIMVIENPFATYFLFPTVPTFIPTGNPVTSIVSYNEVQISGIPGQNFVTNLVTETYPYLIGDVQYGIGNRQVIAYIPYQATLFLDGNPITTKISNYQTSSNSLGYSNVPAGEYTLVFQPFIATESNFDMYHGGYSPTPTIDGSSGSITVTVLAFRST